MIIGLTGGIGSGKTTVAQFFKEMGAVLFIADIEAKYLMVNDKALVHQITELFGNEAYINGQLNREFIASVVFNDALMLKKLNALVHPKVRSHFNNFVEKTEAAIIIYEAAILFESGSNKICDYIITVTADYNQRIERVLARDNGNKLAIEKRIKHQLNDVEKINASHFVIKNNNLNYTIAQTASIYSMLKELVNN